MYKHVNNREICVHIALTMCSYRHIDLTISQNVIEIKKIIDKFKIRRIISKIEI